MGQGERIMYNIMLDAVELEIEIINILEKEKHLVLATCSEGHVTARTMSHVNAGMDIFFQTDKRFLKGVNRYLRIQELHFVQEICKLKE